MSVLKFIVFLGIDLRNRITPGVLWSSYRLFVFLAFLDFAMGPWELSRRQLIPLGSQWDSIGPTGGTDWTGRGGGLIGHGEGAART